MACSNGLRDLRRDLRRDRLSRLYATPDRTAPWRAGRDSYFLTHLHRKTDQRDRGGSAFPHRVRRVSDVTTYGVAGNIEASEKNSIDRARLMRSCIRLAGLCP